MYRNLLPDAASANGGYENLESVASSGANQSKNTTTDNNNKISSNSHPHPSAPASGDAHNIYQNQEAPGFPRGQQTTPGGTPSEGMTTKQMPQVANVAAASQIISLSPSRMVNECKMYHYANRSVYCDTFQRSVSYIFCFAIYSPFFVELLELFYDA